MQEKFNLFLTPGNLGFYKSCEITQLFLHRKSDGKNIHLFILATFEEKPFTQMNHRFLTNKPIKINSEYSLGVQRYNLDLDTVSKIFTDLIELNKWNFEGNSDLILPVLKSIPPQFVPAKSENSLGKILKNNFLGGSYLIELFDESKLNFDFLLDLSVLDNYNEIFTLVKNVSGIDLQLMRDRIGNVIFQFRISLLKLNSRALSSWDGVKLDFVWHPEIITIPDCIIEMSSTYDSNYLGSTTVEYNKSNEQTVIIGNLDGQKTIRLWLKETQLLVFLFDGTYFRDFTVNPQMASPEPRVFTVNGTVQEVTVHSSGMGSGRNEDRTYMNAISARLYNTEREKLIADLSFMQFGKGRNQFDEAIAKLRELIDKFDSGGVYLWDPFLHPNDILQTLFFSKSMGVPLKAIGAINDTVINVYQQKGLSVEDIITQYQNIFSASVINTHGLNLEFRCQYGINGWAFHDRFLMFPSTKKQPPKAYSLGTSVNSIGKSHHIIQELNNPQRVIDAFNELWEKLNLESCLVWKSK